MIETHLNSESGISFRGNKYIKSTPRLDLDLFKEASENLYHPVDNPTGCFALNIAENAISSPIILSQIQDILKNNSIPEWVLKYTSHSGNEDVRITLAKTLKKYLGSSAINENNIAISSGAAASLEVISFLLANNGDIAVTPAPSYPMYQSDLGVKSGIEIYHLQTHYDIDKKNTLALLDISHLEKALADIKNNKKQFKILLLTTPDNPSGSIYSIDQLRRIANWCINNKIHLIVNELYALSKIKSTTKGDEFISFSKTISEFGSDYLHLIYSLSKDFSMSGLRVGVIHSLNTYLMKGIDNINIPHMVSNETQWMLGKLFDNEEFIKEYISQNEINITESYKLIKNALTTLNIPFVPSKGGLFVWADFSKYLTSNSKESEKEFWLNIFNKTRVLLTPGIDFGHEKSGMFRIVFTAVPKDYLEIAVDRLISYLKNE